MPESIIQPFMTPVELVRIIAGAIGLKSSNKKLDDYANKYDQPYTLAPSLFREVVAEPLSKYIHPDFSDRFTASFDKILNDYIELVNSVSMDGVIREDVEKVITRWLLDSIAVQLNLFMGQIVDGPNFLAGKGNHENALTLGLNWLSTNFEWWDSYIHYIPKENRYRLNLWRENEELPNFSSITNIANFLENAHVNEGEWQKIKAILLAARYFDSLRRDHKELYPDKLINISVLKLKHVEQYIWEMKESNLAWLDPLKLKLLEIEYIFFKKNDFKEMANHERKQRSKELIDKLELETLKYSTFKAGYWLNWFKARWYALNGEMKSANQHFKKAFEQALFHAGPLMSDIINEALSVASNQQPGPDKAFIKRLKNAAILFGIEAPLFKDDISELNANRFDTVAEDWEVSLYRRSLEKYFPGKFLFGGKRAEQLWGSGPLVVTDELEPNFRSPNKKFYIGETWQKMLPQIAYFSWLNKVDIVSKLIDKNAKVNALTQFNESALLFSILHMDVTQFDANMDDRMFNILSKHNYLPEVINAKTSKRKLQPLVCAVDTGRPEVVRKVLDMGANLNFRGYTDNQSPLFLALSRICAIKRPDVFMELADSPPITKELLDSLRRHNNGLNGVTLVEVEQAYIKQDLDPLYTRIKNSLLRLTAERIQEYMSLKKLREIALELIHRNADTNAKHKTRIKGFTPLMLAAELDEIELFEAMILKDGNPFLTVKDPNTGLLLDSYHIAFAHQSTQVLEYLNKNKKHLFNKFQSFMERPI